ncbi:hypothetical protein QTP88_004306 [Uroleucon formosanum]
MALSINFRAYTLNQLPWLHTYFLIERESIHVAWESKCIVTAGHAIQNLWSTGRAVGVIMDETITTIGSQSARWGCAFKAYTAAAVCAVCPVRYYCAVCYSVHPPNTTDVV